MPLARRISSCLTNRSKNQSTNDDTEHDANIHKRPIIPRPARLSRADRCPSLDVLQRRSPTAEERRLAAHSPLVIPSEVACHAVALCEGWEESLINRIILRERA